MPLNKRHWPKKTLAFLRDNYNTKTNPQLAKAVNVPLQVLRQKLYEMGLYRMRLEYWTNEQISFLKKHYKKIGDQELAEIFESRWPKEKGWTLKHIEKKRLYLGLKRTKEELKKIRERNRLRGCWIDTTTWQTRGVLPNGTVKIWRNINQKTESEYLFKAIKVKGHFVPYAHWLFVQLNGPMKKDHVIGFKDGDNMNVSPENLEQITRSEHAMRYGRESSLPLEVRELNNLLKQLNFIIQQKTK